MFHRRLMRSRLLQAGLALGIVAASAAWIVPAAAQDTVTTITFWKPPNTESTKEEALWADVIADFEAANPGIDVVYNQVPWSQLDTQFTAGFAGSTPPDVFYLPDEFYPKYAASGQILPLPEEFNALKPLYTAAIWEGGTYGGALYGIPFLTACKALLVNHTLLDKLGLPEPKTWEDIAAITKAAADPAAGVYGFYVADSAYYPTLLGAGGTQLIGSDLSSAIPNADAATSAFAIGAETLAATGGVLPLSMSKDQAGELMVGGKIAIMWIDVSQLSRIRAKSPDLALSVMAVPAVDGTSGKPSAFSATGYMMVAQNSKNKDAALAFLKFVSSAEVQKTYVVEGTQNFSPMIGIPASPADPLLQDFADLLEVSVPITASVNWSQAKDVLNTYGEAVLSGQSAARPAIDSAALEISSFLSGR